MRSSGGRRLEARCPADEQDGRAGHRPEQGITRTGQGGDRRTTASGPDVPYLRPAAGGDHGPRHGSAQNGYRRWPTEAGRRTICNRGVGELI